MPKLFSRIFRHAKRRIKKGQRDQRTFQLHQAARRLLAEKDHEQVSVTQLAGAAGISVGAFYQRFPNKDAFLGRVVHEGLHSAQQQMERELNPERWRRSTAGEATQAIVEAMMRGLHGPGAGVVRAALKRGHLDRKKLEPLVRYRAALADSAVALLVPRLKGVRHPERAVRSAMQIAEATALDALLHDAGTLRSGSQRMADTLSAMMLGMLGLSHRRPVNPQGESDETPARAEDDGQEAMLDMPTEEVIAVPIPEPALGQRRTTRRKVAREPETEPIKVVRPTLSVPEAIQEPEQTRPEPTRRRRHRPRF
jgi:AcrR family transcriptional regulator